MKKPRDFVQCPKGGWKYTEPETGVKFEHIHHKAFLADIFKHREACGLYTGGGWQAIVWDHVCAQNPQIEHVDEDIPERRMTLDDARAFAKTVSNWMGMGFATVPPEEAERRASICTSGNGGESCPHNKVLNGCWGCKGALNWIVELMGEHQTSKDADLHSCDRCFCILRAKVHLPLEAIENPDGYVLPTYCWMVKPELSSA